MFYCELPPPNSPPCLLCVMALIKRQEAHEEDMQMIETNVFATLWIYDASVRETHLFWNMVRRS